MRTRALHTVLAGLPVLMAAALLINHLCGLTHGVGPHGVVKVLLLASRKQTLAPAWS